MQLEKKVRSSAYVFLDHDVPKQGGWQRAGTHNDGFGKERNFSQCISACDMHIR